MNRSALAAPLVAVAVVGSFLAGGHDTPSAVAADTSDQTNGVVVDGLGKVSGTPDVLRVTLGVSVKRADVTTALDDANAAQNRLRAALGRAGVDKADLQTSDVSVYPSYDNRGRRDGYQVTETLTAKLRDLGKAGTTMAKAVEAGGKDAVLQGVSFSLEDNVALLAQARDKAYAEARAKAEQYARLSGRTLGKVELMTESTSAPQPVAYGFADSAKAASSAIPVDAGSQQVSVSVTVRWALA